MFMTAKEIVERFSKENPDESFIITWWDGKSYIDPEDGITRKVWDKKAPDYIIQYASEESSIIGEYLRGDYQL